MTPNVTNLVVKKDYNGLDCVHTENDKSLSILDIGHSTITQIDSNMNFS